jgi:hypothetical protein
MAEGKGCLRVALAALDTAGGILSQANPEGEDLIITRFIVDVTTPATAACTADFGIAAAATTLSDTLIDGPDVHSAAVCLDSADATDQGTNGNASRKWSSTQYLTGSMASGAAAGLGGYAYVEYVRK